MTPIRILLTCACTSLLSLAVACAPMTRAEAPNAPPDAQPRAQPHTAIADGILAEANAARQQAGVAPLRPWDAVNAVAQQYAAELAARGRLDHNSPIPGRETMGRRLDAGGVAWLRAAENLALRVDEPAELPRSTVGGWLRSPGHAANLLEPAYTHTGVGVARSPEGRWYMVQLYVLPAGDR